MKNNSKHKLSEISILYILSGAIINMGVLYLPSSVGKSAKQDGWISVLIASIYPLYIIFCALYLKKKHNKENILMLNNKYFGKYLGSLFNLIFMSTFIIFLASSASATFNFVKTYTSINLNRISFMFMFLIIGAFAANLGLKTLIKISGLVFYFIIPIFLIGFNIFKFGSVLNLLPVGASGDINILKGSLETIYAYGGMELLLILYSDFNDEKKLRNYSLLTVVFVVFIYTFTTLLIGVYWENSLVQKVLWPSIYIVESIRNPLINNLRFILLYLWTILTLRSISIYYYFCNEILTYTFNRFKIKDYYLILYIISGAIALIFKNEVMRREYTGKLVSFLTLINLLIISTIIIFTFTKRKLNDEK